jgi:hypothetical protein
MARAPAPWWLRLALAIVRPLAAAEEALSPTRRCFEPGCGRVGTHRIRVVVRAERGERRDVMAHVVVPAVLCATHATADGLSADAVMPRDHRRQIARGLERRIGCPIDWSRSVVEVRHRLLAWLTWGGG